MVSNRYFLTFQCSSQWVTKAVEDTLTKADKVGHRNILTAVMDAVDPETGGKMTLEETVIVSAGFMHAAADTTATSLTFILYHCLNSPGVWNRLCDEVRSRYEKEEEITGQSTANLPYLDAVIHEGNSFHTSSNAGMRLRPAVHPNLTRETPPEGMTIAGHFVPGNVTICVRLI
jgi:cytochrome P450